MFLMAEAFRLLNLNLVHESTWRFWGQINLFRLREVFWIPTDGLEVPGTRYWVPGTRYQVLGTGYQVPGTRYQVAGIRYWVPSIRYQVPGTKY